MAIDDDDDVVFVIAVPLKLEEGELDWLQFLCGFVGFDAVWIYGSLGG